MAERALFSNTKTATHLQENCGARKPYFAYHIGEPDKARSAAADTALSLWTIVERNRAVGFWDNLDLQHRIMNDIDDHLYDVVRRKKGIALSTEEMDEIINGTMQLARYRLRS